MKKKIINIFFIIILLMFSFYYTDRVIDLIRNTDPIMRQIKKSNDKYKVKAINANVNDNKIIPGVVGVEVDYKKSYQKMKNYGTYNEALTVFKETKPTISVDDYYDKFIINGNGISNQVALVFSIKPGDNLVNITNILLEQEVDATLFIDGLWMDNNLEYVKSLTNFELELLSYDNRYEELYFSSSINSLSTLSNRDMKYCYAEYDRKEVLDICSKLGLHTIIPTIKTGSSPYIDIKNKLRNSDIISLGVNTSTEIELPTIINYIKQKGYNLVRLDVLLSESVEK